MPSETVSKQGSIKCKCGKRVTIEMVKYAHVKCECGKFFSHSSTYLSPTEVLEALGFQLALDWDESLMIESELPLTNDQSKWFFLNQAELRCSLLSRAQAERTVFMGGSLNGQRHGLYGRSGTHKHMHIKNRHWETYRFEKDGRLVFVGKSTSERKAKDGTFVS